MKRLIGPGLAFSMTACSSIVSQASYPVTIDSAPSGANISISDEKGNRVFEGSGPATLSLRSGDKYFSRAMYTVEVESDGMVYTSTLRPSLDRWYFGNVLFGGLVGFLVVDPLTGAMYKLPEQFTIDVPAANTAPSAPSTASKGLSVQVLSMADIPIDLRDELEAVQ